MRIPTTIKGDENRHCWWKMVARWLHRQVVGAAVVVGVLWCFIYQHHQYHLGQTKYHHLHHSLSESRNGKYLFLWVFVIAYQNSKHRFEYRVSIKWISVFCSHWIILSPVNYDHTKLFSFWLYTVYAFQNPSSLIKFRIHFVRKK